MTDPMQEWLKTRPECVQNLARKFPPGASFLMEGVLYYVIGYREPDALMVSATDPSVDYDLAMENKKYICADHFL